MTVLKQYIGGVWTPVAVGAQGTQGYQGYQGSQGNQGSQGFQGNQGNQGFQGNQGYQGSQGYQGNQGNQALVVSTSTPLTTNNLWYNPNATGTTATMAAAGKNFIINGGMEINQRNLTNVSTASIQYTIDRWYTSITGTNGTFYQQAPWTTLAGFSQSVRFYQNGTNPTTFNFSQSLETNNVVPLQGQTVTLSFYASVDTSNWNQLQFSVFLKYSTGTDANLYNSGTSITPTAVSNINASTGLITSISSWTRCTATYTVPSNATSLAVVFSTPAGIYSGSEFNITGVQLEANPIATVFSRAGGTYQGEIAQCQRYYFQMVHPPMKGVSSGTTTISRPSMQLPVTMRTTPTISAVGTFDGYNGITVGTVTTFAGGTFPTTNSMEFGTCISSASYTAGQIVLFYNGSSTGYVTASAEI